jgi:hypothetical protein
VKSIPQNVSAAVRRRNPHLYGDAQLGDMSLQSEKGGDKNGEEQKEGKEMLTRSAGGKPPAPSKRIRQSSKPKMNKLETEWLQVLQSAYDGCPILCQAVKLELATGLWYTPDFFVSASVSYPEKSIAWEVKGPHAFGGALEKLKMAARVHPWCKFYLVWKLDGAWKEQEVLP